MKTRAAVAFEAGRPLEIVEVEQLVGIQAADQPTFEKLYRLLPAPSSSPHPSASAPA